MNIRRVLSVAPLFVLLLLPSRASGQAVGFIAGGTVDPEQVYAGAFFESPLLAQRVRLRPGVDASRGGGLKVAAINLDFIFRGETPTGWQFYTGGGPLILFNRIDEGADDAPAEVDEVTGGFMGLLGFSHRSGFLTEFKFGQTKYGPNLKIGAGWKFGKR